LACRDQLIPANLGELHDQATRAAEQRRRGARALPEPTVFGVADDTDESPIEIYVNGTAAETVNDFMRELATVLREATS
jgi:hypothetical protein